MELIKIGELAKRSQVSIATLKHYLREGLIHPSRKTGRTMSWYDAALVGRVRAIKELQRRQFLPLDLIKRALSSGREAPDDHATANAIAAVLAKHTGTKTRTRAELLAQGASSKELDWLAAAGLAVPRGADQRYGGDDLALLSTLGQARRAGLSAEMLPFTILNDYLGALRALVEVELRLFRAGVIKRGGAGDVAELAATATEFSERLVVLLRRKLLLPVLGGLIEAERREAPATSRPRSRPRPRRPS